MTALSTDEGEPTIAITLGRGEALVLDNLLWRWRSAGSPQTLILTHDAERHILAGVNALLTGELVSFYSQDDYASQIAAAREGIIGYWGAWQDEVEAKPNDLPDSP